jgi:hypothetical protein
MAVGGYRILWSSKRLPSPESPTYEEVVRSFYLGLAKLDVGLFDDAKRAFARATEWSPRAGGVGESWIGRNPGRRARSVCAARTEGGGAPRPKLDVAVFRSYPGGMRLAVGWLTIL